MTYRLPSCSNERANSNCILQYSGQCPGTTILQQSHTSTITTSFKPNLVTISISMLFRVALLLSSFAFVPRFATAAVTSVTVKKEDLGQTGGEIRYHYDDSGTTATCETILMIGVGTAMGVADYDKVSTEMAKESFSIVVITDTAPGHPIKEKKQIKFAALADYISMNLSTVIPICKNAPKNGIVVGGHSASGQAALDSIPLLKSFTAVGFMGMDPFIVPDPPPVAYVAIPTIDWGFAKITCLVRIDEAGKSAYEVGNPKARVFYQIQNQNSTKEIKHCSFTDNGCPACSIGEDESQDVRIMVGETSKKFVAALESGIFVKSAFEITSSVGVNLFVNEDTVDAVLGGQEPQLVFATA
jgi:hypothetical protein